MKDTALNTDLFSDRLVGVVDRIRRRVHGVLGTRPWTVEIVKRIWSGGDRGLGSAKTSVLILDPIPKVERVTRNRQGPAGAEAEGEIVLSEVSLRYSESEIHPKGNRFTEVAYRLVEKLGTKQKVTYYVVAGDPVPRRGDKSGDGIDWYIRLKEVPDLGPFDEVQQS